MDRDERVQPGACAATDKHLLVVERLGVGLYRGQFDPLPPLPDEPDVVFEEVPVEPDVVGLPDAPPADEVVALGSEVVLTGGTDVVPSEVPSGVPVGSPVVVPGEVSSPDGTLPVLPGNGIGAPVPVPVVELTPEAPPLVLPSPSPLPPLAEADAVLVELSSLTEPRAVLRAGAVLLCVVLGERGAEAAERAMPAPAGLVASVAAPVGAVAVGELTGAGAGAREACRTAWACRAGAESV
jgi:hypothetical protein